MSSCPCGHALSVDDRFCVKCGLPISGAAAAERNSGSDSESQPGALPSGEMAAGDNDLLLLSPASSESVETSSVVHSSFPTRWAVVGVLAVAGMMWALYSWPQAEATSGGDEAADTTADESGLRLGVDDGKAAVGDEADDQPEQAGDVEDEPDVVERDGSIDTALGSDSASGAESDPDDENANEPGGSLVGELTGQSLVIGSFDRGRPVKLVSLDTGDELELKGVSGRPIGMIETHLVVANWDSILTVDLASEERQAITVHDSESGSMDLASIDGGKIWTMLDEGDGQLEFVGFSVAGEVIERRELFGLGFYFGTPGTGDLVSSDVGGIYRRSGTEYERLSTGRLRALGEKIALVDECDDSLRCTSVWYARESWERVDLPSPAFAHISRTEIVGNDRWLVTVGLSENIVEFVEIATGKVERTIDDASLGPFLSIPVSDDGRWLFGKSAAGDSVVTDMDSGMEWPIEAELSPDAAVGIVDLSGITLDDS